MSNFDRSLSLRIDACYVELERVQAMPRSARRMIRLLVLRCKLAVLLRRIPV